MEPDSTGYISEFARGYVQQGRDEGRIAGRVDSLRLMLRARAFVLTPAQEQRLAGCTDMSQLDRWIERAMTAPDVDSIFA